ncbi:MAG: hypothetical protein QW594_03800 [Candidatus Woesearchaeota archaeon]
MKSADKFFIVAGYSSVTDYALRVVLPIMATTLAFFIITHFFLVFLPWYYSYIILGLGVGFIILYPLMEYQKVKVKIDEKMHLMITYAGTISTIDIQRTVLFKNLSEKKEHFDEISKAAEKILYFAKTWNLGFSKAARKVASIVPSRMFADFLDRFAIMMDFGEDLKTFLMDEQDAVMDDFEAEYKKSLETIKLIQEVFISFTMTIAFVMSTSVLLPLIAGYPMEQIVQYSLIGVIFVDVFVYFFVRSFVPDDPLLHNLEQKDDEFKAIQRMFYILAPIAVFFTLFLLWYKAFPFLFNIAIGLTPLLIVGIMAQNHEKLVFSKDIAFPSYIRALGSAIEVKMGAVVGSLRNLQVHDFGVLNQLSVNLYRRLRLGSDKYKAWKLYAAESGSYLIAKFSQIFSEGVYMGGNAEKIGEIISKNFNRLIALRKQRIQLASSVRGAFYGSLVGFASASYVAAKITQLLSVMFTQPFSNLRGTDSSLTNLASTIVPASALSINFEVVSLYIGIMVIIHALVSSIIIKIVEGGNSYAALFDFVVMLWIGALISWLLPTLVDMFLPNFTTQAPTEFISETLSLGGGGE